MHQFFAQLCKFSNRNAVFTLAIDTKSELFDEFIPLQGIVDCSAENTGSLAVNNAHRLEIGAHCLVQISLHHDDCLHTVHTAQIHFIGHGSHLHLPAGVLGTALLDIGILILQQIDLILFGLQLHNAGLELIGAVLIDGHLKLQ